MQKKGVELSMNVIIIAAIALVVLVVLVVLVLRAVDNTREGTQCAAGRGTCETGDSTACEGIGEYLPGGGCDDGQVCCVSLTGSS